MYINLIWIIIHSNYQIVSSFSRGKYSSETPPKCMGGIAAYFRVVKEFVHLKIFQNYDERSLIIFLTFT